MTSRPTNFATNVRAGCFERGQFEAVRKHLPDYLQPVITFASLTGWRTKSEIRPLQWRLVDFQAGSSRRPNTAA